MFYALCFLTSEACKLDNKLYNNLFIFLQKFVFEDFGRIKLRQTFRNILFVYLMHILVGY